MKIQILYFSGAGSTRHVAGLMARCLSKRAEIRAHSFERCEDVELGWCDALVVGTPVYHAAPARLVMEFFAAMPPLSEAKPAFVYNTRGLYSCNTNRILAKALAEKDISTVMDRAYGSPASDGSLITPFVEHFFRFEPRLREKIHRDCHRFLQLLEHGGGRAYIPRFRLSSILNAPNKLAGQRITFPIHLHRERCTRCGKCVKHCPHKALYRDAQGYPVFRRGRCENCYRCIHHCPGLALSLSGRSAPRRVLGKQRS